MISKLKRIFEIFKESVINRRKKSALFYIIENADWSIRHDGINIISNIEMIEATTSTRAYGARNAIVHYGSVNTFFRRAKLRLPHTSNRIVVTWFHVEPDDQRTGLIQKALPHVDIWHTSCLMTREKLIRIGIPSDKITIIPLGVKLDKFKPAVPSAKIFSKKYLGIPINKIVVGSFQKDGIGWGKGLDPKWVKGPDIFCDVIERLAIKHNIFVLLTGPARGYVKSRLDKARIPYHHDYVTTPDELVRYYKALDLYLVTSRVEGGPKSILESMASGIPLISTRVGMAPDIIHHGESGLLAEIDDSPMLFSYADQIINDPALAIRLAENGLKTVQNFGWDRIATLYYEKLYSPLIGQSKELK